MIRGAIATIIGLAALVGAPVAAQRAPDPLFADDAPLALTIRAPISALGSARDDAQAGTLTVGVETLPVRLTPRGITRRRKETCSFPPLRVEFPTAPGAGSVFAGQRRLKLVTHCRPAESFQQYVLLEYAAYRLYNVVTPQSFRVRLANIDYVSDAGKSVARRVGFFIEDIDGVAARTGNARARVGNSIPINRLDPAAAGRFAVMAYAISNLDWSMTAAPKGDNCCHNGRLIEGPGGYVPVPYDFDFSGFVNAPYATPPQIVPVANVRVRVYRGLCRHNAGATAAAAELVTKRGALLTAIAAVPGLTEGSRERASSYLSAGLDALATPAKVLDRCLS